jgi:hypothetical protein
VTRSGSIRSEEPEITHTCSLDNAEVLSASSTSGGMTGTFDLRRQNSTAAGALFFVAPEVS